MRERVLAVVERPTGNPIPASKRLPDGRVLVAGWAFQPSGNPIRVRARIGNAAPTETLADRVRNDVGLAHPHVVTADRSGFVLLADTPRRPGRERLRVEAVLKDGVETIDDRPIELDGRRGDDERDDLLFDPGPGPAGARGECGAPSALLISNNFNLEGAPRSLLDLGTRLRAAGFRARVLGPAEGPLSSFWRRAGVEIECVGDPGRIPDLDDYRMRIRRLATYEACLRPDVVVANTLDSFWGADLAEALGVPAVWIIRESVEVETYFLERWPYPIAKRALGALKRAARVVFVARATAALFEHFVPNEHLKVIHNGLDFSQIGRPNDAALRRTARRRLSLPLDRPIITCVGTLCCRKGQRILIEAVARLALGDRAPLCVLVGARSGEYLEIVKRRIAGLGVERCVQLVPETPDPSPYYRAADVAVCPSFEESLPRVVIEAMGFGLPVVASRVNGVPELLEEGVHGWMVPAGEPDLLARAIADALGQPTRSEQVGRAARQRALTEFSIERMAAEYEVLLRQLVRGGLPAEES